MNYEAFKKAVKEKFMDYMPEKFSGAQLVAVPVEKVNSVVLDGISLKGKDKNISPVIYLNDMYEEYQKCGDFEKTLRTACASIERVYEQMSAIDMDGILKHADEKIIFQLINTEQNKALLGQMPHRHMQDLSVVYKIIVSADEHGIRSIKVTNELAKKLGMSEADLFMAALENTKRIFPPTVHSMNDVVKEILARNGMSDIEMPEIPPEQMMWVVSNEIGVNGAASMLYMDILGDLAKKSGNDLYILPSSIHEVIAVSADMGSPQEFAQMVAAVNATEVPPNERLSDQVYYYEKDTQSLSLATDTEYTREPEDCYDR